MAKVPLRFIQSHPPYNVGEVAGFARDVALGLVRRGVGVPHTDEAHAVLRAASVEAEDAGDEDTAGPPAQPAQRTPLPSDFPGRAAFDRVGFTSVEEVAQLYAGGGEGALLDISGIGPATAEDVVAELEDVASG